MENFKVQFASSHKIESFDTQPFSRQVNNIINGSIRNGGSRQAEGLIKEIMKHKEELLPDLLEQLKIEEKVFC